MSAKIEVPLRMLKDALRAAKSQADFEIQAEAIKGIREIIAVKDLEARQSLQSRFFASCLSDIKKSEDRRHNRDHQPAPVSAATNKEGAQ